MDKIRLGTIGSGPIVYKVLTAAKEAEGIELCAVYSRNEDTGNKLANEFQCEKVYTDFDAFLNDEEVNFVYAASPNLLHYEQSKKALLAGKNVYCEKPFTSTTKECEELFQLAKEKNLILLEAAPTMYIPNFYLFQEEIKKLGDIKLVMGNFTQYSSRYDQLREGEMTNIFDPKMAGGCLMDINIYNILVNIGLFGKPKDIKYFPNFYKDTNSDTSGIAILDYGSFTSACIGSKDAKGENFFVVEGEKGSIKSPYVSQLPSLHVVTDDGDEEITLQDDPNHRIYQMKEFARIILENDTERIAYLQQITKDLCETLEKARKSAHIVFPND